VNGDAAKKRLPKAAFPKEGDEMKARSGLLLAFSFFRIRLPYPCGRFWLVYSLSLAVLSS